MLNLLHICKFFPIKHRSSYENCSLTFAPCDSCPYLVVSICPLQQFAPCESHFAPCDSNLPLIILICPLQLIRPMRVIYRPLRFLSTSRSYNLPRANHSPFANFNHFLRISLTPCEYCFFFLSATNTNQLHRQQTTTNPFIKTQSNNVFHLLKSSFVVNAPGSTQFYTPLFIKLIQFES